MNEAKKEVIIKLERISETVLQMYRERTAEKEEQMFTEKRRGKKRTLSIDNSEEPQAKKSKKNKKEPDEYIVEKILTCKYENGDELYHIKWQGWSDSDNTWEPIENLNCPEVFKEFVTRMENEHCEQFEQIKTEISFGDLLNEENLVKILPKCELSHLWKTKETLIVKLICINNFKQNKESVPSELIEATRHILQMYVLIRKRSRQLIQLKNWEDQINLVDKSKKLSVENSEDFEGPPVNFTYIEQSIPGDGVTIPDDPPIGCDCATCNCRSKTCCGMQGGLFAYTSNKLLRVAPGIPIYECNKTCKCSENCCNKVVQSGRNVKLTIFRTNNGCGWAVRTDQRIREGQFVCQYVGEVISFEEAEKREKEYDAIGMTYLFDLDFNSSDEPYTIDAASMGNVSHFINHSCDPNLEVWAVWANCLDPNLPMLALFATRDIEAGEEIHFDYLHKSIADARKNAGNEMTDVGRFNSPPRLVISSDEPNKSSPAKSRFETQQQTMTNLRNRTECKCGAVKCRRYLF